MRGRRLLAVLVATLACSATAGPDVEVRVERDGRALAVAKPAAVAAKVAALAESCSVHADKPDSWPAALAAGSFVHVVFAAPRRMRLEAPSNQDREERLVRELLLTLPEGRWPRQVLVKTEKEMIGLAKCLPRQWRELAQQDDLQLRGVAPYDSLLRAR